MSGSMPAYHHAKVSVPPAGPSNQDIYPPLPRLQPCGPTGVPSNPPARWGCCSLRVCLPLTSIDFFLLLLLVGSWVFSNIFLRGVAGGVGGVARSEVCLSQPRPPPQLHRPAACNPILHSVLLCWSDSPLLRPPRSPFSSMLLDWKRLPKSKHRHTFSILLLLHLLFLHPRCDCDWLLSRLYHYYHHMAFKKIQLGKWTWDTFFSSPLLLPRYKVT